MAGNGIKAAEYRCFDACLCVLLCVCVHVCTAACFGEACILTKIQTEKKRAASRVTATLSIVGFVNVLLGASLQPSESHSP